MTDDTVIKLMQPGSFEDPLTEVLRNGARALLTQAVEAEVATFVGRHADFRMEDGRVRIVRHGHLPEREILTGLGPLAVRQPRFAIEARRPTIRSASASAPPCCRHTHGGPRASMCCCRYSTCVACRPATSRRR